MQVRLACLLASILTSAACQPPPISADSNTESGETGDGDSCEFRTDWRFPIARLSLDILVVVDGSIGSAGAQTRLAAGLEQLLAELDASEYGLDYRIAITTTDMGPPVCDPLVTTPELGQFVDTSCRERLGDFVDADGQDFTSSCTDACSLELIERLPTSTLQEPAPAPRPWLERDGAYTNLPPTVDPLDALRCTAMVGVAGCRYESPLAAAEAALIGSQTPGHPNYGFFRYASRWALVIVSDAEDCSWSEAGLAIFDPDGERAFWSDPMAAEPTPAVCWNAGTECDNTLEGLHCNVMNYSIDGEKTGLPEAIVLRPTTEFSDLLGHPSTWELDVTLFAGLTLDEDRIFDQTSDPDFVLEHGIGPGCDDGAGTVALPPVRTYRFLRSLLWSNEDEQLPEQAESICAPDFGPTLAALGQRLREEVDAPTCYIGSPCDADPSTQLLEVDCIVEAYPGDADPYFPDSEPVAVAECPRAEDGAYLVDAATGHLAMPDADEDLCWVARVDAQQLTPDPHDDAWPACLENDYPLGLELVGRDGRIPDEVIMPACLE